MFKIHIQENFPNPHSVIILADGSLDDETIPILRNVFERHWVNGKKIKLDLEGLIRISREGMDFLNEIQGKIQFLNIPKFIRLNEENFPMKK
jgi:ABC-type transporter Mla MlaB component